MSQSRRSFLGAAATFAAVSAWGATSLAAQSQIPLPMPRLPSVDPFPRRPTGIGGPMSQREKDDRLKRNQTEIKKNMARLTELVCDLQEEFDASSTTTVLSLGAVRKAEEIEKLARQIRDLIRG